MKKRIAIALLLVLLCGALSATALAVYATPNQRLAFRSGPNTRYTELFMMSENTRVVAYETEYGNDVAWVLLEFVRNGKVQRAYTGLKRVDVFDYLPSARLAFQSACMRASAAVYAAPTDNTVVRGRVGRNEVVTYLNSENGYDYIEFYDSDSGQPSRGYIPSDSMYYLGDTAAFMKDSSSVYASPCADSDRVGWVGKYEMVSFLDYENGYARICFYSANRRELLIGYVPNRIVDTYNY